MFYYSIGFVVHEAASRIFSVFSRHLHLSLEATTSRHHSSCGSNFTPSSAAHYPIVFELQDEQVVARTPGSYHESRSLILASFSRSALDTRRVLYLLRVAWNV
jgi:hypothetical protein